MDITAPHFLDTNAAREYLESKRWPMGPVCPHCNETGKAYRLKAKEGSKTPVRPGVLKCKACRKQFTVTVGTIFADSKIPLNKWLLAVHLLCASKKGMSAHQLHRMLGITYKSAWFMAHRIRYAMGQEPLSSKLSGTVDVDETYVGGKEKGKRGMPGKDSKKTPVVAMVEGSLVKDKKRTKTGKVRSFVAERVTAKNLRPVLKETIVKGSELHTDEAKVYKSTEDAFPAHKVVNHSAKEYVRIEDDGTVITTNTAEGYFSLLKRGINGVYHQVSKQYLHRYLSEFDFRYNARDIDDRQRADLTLAQTGGKGLTYRDSCRHGA